MKVLVNMISDVEHSDLEEALKYYNLEYTDIEDLDELCETLNDLDLYGCGSSFEIQEVK